MAVKKPVDVYDYVAPRVFVRAPYNYDVDAASDESGLDCSVEPSLTQQQFAEEVDINTIVKRFGLSGELPVGVRAPMYGDFSEVHDFKSAMDAIALANEAFDQMPAEVRARFHHDPQEFLEFCNDEKNFSEAERLGLVMPKEAVSASIQAAGELSAGGVTPLLQAEAPKGPGGTQSGPGAGSGK